uniref:B-related factor 1 n=1 Tax=Arion vulgaris TaxID=1028688 RepID=A0A0B6ZNB7_9EUPU
MPRTCSQCGCSDIETDPSRGDAVCTNCGTVLEDQIIVSEVQYQESSAGGASVIGQFVSNDGTRAQSFRGAYGHGFSSEESRKLTLENGYRRLKELGGQLRMHQSSIETAFGFFKLAVGQRFTRGRKMEHVLASCLYLVCRVDPGGSEDLELMLIDFSDLIQANVHVLGRTFVQLATELCQNIRIVDPVIYIRRFANQLHFEDRINKVVESATRLVARMKRDWMHTGRRPAGLCGAALLISSRMHNFNRTIDQIIKVVKVCESTVRKRLLEFDSTPSAQLTIEEFDNVDLEEEQDPPCFTEGKKKAKLAQSVLKDELPDTMLKELSKFEENINKSLRRQFMVSEDSVDGMREIDTTVKLIDEETVKEAAGEDWKTGVDVTEDDDDRITIIKEDSGSGSIPEITVSAAENTDEIRYKKEENVDNQKEGDDETGKILAKIENGELDLTGIDDEEIDKLIMSEEEIQHKAKWFDLEFGDYMEIVREREEKRRIKEEAAAKKKEKNPKAKKKRKGGYNLETELAECMEILEKGIREKKLSDKINYNVLSALDDTSPRKPLTNEPIEIVDDGTISVGDLTEQKPQIVNRFRKSSLSEPNTKKKNSGKRVVIQESVEQRSSKKAKLAIEEEVNATIIIEEPSNPVPYGEQAVDVVEDDEEEEDEEEDEEDKMFSARRFLSQDVSHLEEEHEYYY